MRLHRPAGIQSSRQGGVLRVSRFDSGGAWRRLLINEDV